MKINIRCAECGVVMEERALETMDGELHVSVPAHECKPNEIDCTLSEEEAPDQLKEIVETAPPCRCWDFDLWKT